MEQDFVDVWGEDELGEGEIHMVEWAGEPVLLARVGGRIHAVGGLCPHEDAPMDKGYIKEGCLHCPLHGSYFDLETGAVQADPAEEDIAVHAVRREHGRILVGPPID